MSGMSLVGLPSRSAISWLCYLLCGEVVTPGFAFQLTKHAPAPETSHAGRNVPPPRRKPIQTTPPSDESISKMWEHFKENRKLDTFHQHHEEAFKANVVRAHSLNDEHGVDCTDLFAGPNCIFGITKFSHLRNDEFKTAKLGFKPNMSARSGSAPPIVMNLKGVAKEDEMSVDWRSKGAVTPVKDQLMCGSCWAFSAVSEIESSVFIATGQLQELSTQQVISCDPFDMGCEGGDTTLAYEYVAHAGGIDTAANYPDHSHATGLTGTCEWSGNVAAKITGYSYAVEPCWDGACQNQDEDRLAQVVAEKGPVSICVMADEWMYYTGGVFNSQSCSGAADMLDHCVQLVGYNKEEETPYWIVRNSWNTDWGMDGYIYLAMGSNLCGVADEAQLATVSL